jgi:hypothetical protein
VSTAALSSKRKRVTGKLAEGARGFSILTDTGELWVLDRADVESDLVGRVVTAEGNVTGLDRIQPDWIGETSR